MHSQSCMYTLKYPSALGSLRPTHLFTSILWDFLHEWNNVVGLFIAFSKNNYRRRNMNAHTQTHAQGKQRPKPESPTSGFCYCTQVKWHPTVHGDSNRISRGCEKTNITCCASSRNFPFSHRLHQVPLSLISSPQCLSSSIALRPQHLQPNQFPHTQQSNHFHNVSVSMSEREGKLLSSNFWNAVDCWEGVTKLHTINSYPD